MEEETPPTIVNFNLLPLLPEGYSYSYTSNDNSPALVDKVSVKEIACPKTFEVWLQKLKAINKEFFVKEAEYITLYLKGEIIGSKKCKVIKFTE